MKVLGLVTEYNPFHNGHLYHVEESKKVTGCDTVVCIMSGNFIQRGQPAIVNKWARTEMALRNQIDLVIELPVYYSVSSAEFFAYGAIKLLDSLGIIDSVCFGSEYNDIEILSTVARTLIHEPLIYKDKLSYYLGQGLSFPKARALALDHYFSQSGEEDSKLIGTIMNQPNNILGIEYIKALYKLKSRIKPTTIKRHKVAHNSHVRYDNYASATAIREMLKSTDFDTVKAVVPPSTSEIIVRELSQGRAPVLLDSFDTILLSTIRKMVPSDINAITDVGEGMENRIKKAAQAAGTISQLLISVKTKRYTLTRLQRILMRILLGLSEETFKSFNSNGGPQYLRVLGFSNKGKELLNKIKSSSLPLISTVPDFLRSCNIIQKEMITADILASDIYSLGYPSFSQRSGGQDYYQKIISI